MAREPLNPGSSWITRPVTGIPPPGSSPPRPAHSTIVTTPPRATSATTTPYRMRHAGCGPASSTNRHGTVAAWPTQAVLEPGAELGDEGGNDLPPVADDADVGGCEDRHVPLLVDGQDRARRAHADHVVELPAQGDGDVEVRGDRAAGEADLAGVRQPALVGHLAGGA